MTKKIRQNLLAYTTASLRMRTENG